MRLALARGCSVAELLATTSAREVREYEAFSRIEPFGDWWRAAGLLCAMIFNSQRASEDAKWWTPEDFVNLDGRAEADDETPPQTSGEIMAAFGAAGCRVVLNDS